MLEKYQIHIGGSVEKALKGQYDLDIKKVLTEAWQHNKQDKGILLLGIFLTVAISLAAISLSTPFSSLEQLMLAQRQMDPFLALLVTLFITPIMAGLNMIGVRKSLGAPVQVNDLFKYVPSILLLGVTELAVGLLVNLGLSLLIIPGIYLLITTVFAIPLVSEKRATPLKAIWISIRAVNHKLPQFILLFLIVIGLMLLCILTMGIAYIWVGPFYFNVKGVIYRNLFGAVIRFNQNNDNNKGQGNNESVFEA
ncbi:hypothetical protein [Neptunicella marina]|uniref:DUF975 family protein n=1 Tax=Neptunicella marina TaxID=2125989 RepID=A0A8J6IV47_9ALTE|nr:hypothetical protein [Neptunicella marina]MBC3766934.1 hypothetical protein [Neptunicella marina]